MSYHTVSHSITSYPILPYSIVSYPILSYHITPHHIKSTVIIIKYCCWSTVCFLYIIFFGNTVVSCWRFNILCNLWSLYSAKWLFRKYFLPLVSSFRLKMPTMEGRFCLSVFLNSYNTDLEFLNFIYQNYWKYFRHLLWTVTLLCIAQNQDINANTVLKNFYSINF